MVQPVHCTMTAGDWPRNSSAMVGMAGQDGRRAVELLGQHHADQTMRPSLAPKGQVRSAAPGPPRPARRYHRSGTPRRAFPGRATCPGAGQARRCCDRGRARPGPPPRPRTAPRPAERRFGILAPVGRKHRAGCASTSRDGPGATAHVVGEQGVEGRLTATADREHRQFQSVLAGGRRRGPASGATDQSFSRS